jgi:hypothetical protein
MQIEAHFCPEKFDAAVKKVMAYIRLLVMFY